MATVTFMGGPIMRFEGKGTYLTHYGYTVIILHDFCDLETGWPLVGLIYTPEEGWLPATWARNGRLRYSDNKDRWLMQKVSDSTEVKVYSKPLVPWTREDYIELVKEKGIPCFLSKSTGNLHNGGYANTQGTWFAGIGLVNWRELLVNYTLLNGDPCGK